MTFLSRFGLLFFVLSFVLAVALVILALAYRRNAVRVERKERLAKVMQAASLCTFEYNVAKDTVYLSTASAELLNLPEEILDFSQKSQTGTDEERKKSLTTLQKILSPAANGTLVKIYRRDNSQGMFVVCNLIFSTKKDRMDYVTGVLKDNTEAFLQEERLATRAQIDGLTRVYNSGAIRQLVKRGILDAEGRGGFIITDIDYFKSVNDDFGHQMGDQVLMLMAETLKHTVRRSDMVGRLGGDEFCLYLENIPSTEFLEKLCRRLNEGVTRRMAEANVPLKITISIGATMFAVGDDFDRVYERADKALYEAKERGRNTFVIGDGDADG